MPLLTDANLSPATTYYYAIEASSSGSTIDGSACATTPPLPITPIVSAVAESSSAVLVTWQEDVALNSLAIRSFRLYRGTTPSNLTEIAAVQRIAYVDHVSPATTYYYAVQAIDVEGNASALSVPVQVTTPN